jgi:hypothetical protein
VNLNLNLNTTFVIDLDADMPGMPHQGPQAHGQRP